MSEEIAAGHDDGEQGGWGGNYSVRYDSNAGEEKLSVAVQVYTHSERREEQCLLEFGVNEDARTMATLITAQTGTAYGLCVAAQVGAHVWNDYLNCKAAAKAKHPTGSWRQIQTEALKCLAQKHPGIQRAFTLALISCTPTLLPTP